MNPARKPHVSPAGLVLLLVFAAAMMTPAVALAQNTSTQGQVTFASDIAPILQRSCQNCHRPGSIAPMPLLTYEQVRPWARAIKQKVVVREMPPWYIDRHVGIRKFKGDPSLTDAEIAKIVNWVDGGAPLGNPADVPPPRQFTDLDQWHIGKPDLVLTMPREHVVKAQGPDESFDIDVDLPFTEDVYVQAVETKPANPQSFRVIHHATTNLIEDEDDPIGLFFNEYALGKNGDIFPENTGRLVKAGSKLHFNLHLHSIGEEISASVHIALKLYPKSVVPKYVLFTQHMGDNNELDIPAGQVSRHDGYFRLPRPAVITAFQPHMHNRGKAMCMAAIFPDVRPDSARPGPARTDTLSCVSNYLFGWHITYPYADDLAPLLPAGTVIHVTGWHDNSTANRWNPNPRNWVGSGSRTIDEMSFAWVSLYYLDEADYQQRLAAKNRTSN